MDVLWEKRLPYLFNVLTTNTHFLYWRVGNIPIIDKVLIFHLENSLERKIFLIA